MIVSDSENAATHLGAKRMLSVIFCPVEISNAAGLASNESPSSVIPVAPNDYTCNCQPIAITVTSTSLLLLITGEVQICRVSKSAPATDHFVCCRQQMT